MAILAGYLMGRGGDLNPGKRLHRPLGYQATSPRPLLYIDRIDPDYFLLFWTAIVTSSFLVFSNNFRFFMNIKLSFLADVFKYFATIQVNQFLIFAFPRFILFPYV